MESWKFLRINYIIMITFLYKTIFLSRRGPSQMLVFLALKSITLQTEPSHKSCLEAGFLDHTGLLPDNKNNTLQSLTF